MILAQCFWWAQLTVWQPQCFLTSKSMLILKIVQQLQNFFLSNERSRQSKQKQGNKRTKAKTIIRPRSQPGSLTISQASSSATGLNLLSEVAAVWTEEMPFTCTSSLLEAASNKGRIRCFSSKEFLMTFLANSSNYSGRVSFSVSGKGDLKCMEL